MNAVESRITAGCDLLERLDDARITSTDDDLRSLLADARRMIEGLVLDLVREPRGA